MKFLLASAKLKEKVNSQVLILSPNWPIKFIFIGFVMFIFFTMLVKGLANRNVSQSAALFISIPFSCLIVVWIGYKKEWVFDKGKNVAGLRRHIFSITLQEYNFELSKIQNLFLVKVEQQGRAWNAAYDLYLQLGASTHCIDTSTNFPTQKRMAEQLAQFLQVDLKIHFPRHEA